MVKKQHGLEVYLFRKVWERYKGHQAKIAACLGLSIRTVRTHIYRWDIKSVKVPKTLDVVLEYILNNELEFDDISRYKMISFNYCDKYKRRKDLGDVESD